MRTLRMYDRLSVQFCQILVHLLMSYSGVNLGTLPFGQLFHTTDTWINSSMHYRQIKTSFWCITLTENP